MRSTSSFLLTSLPLKPFTFLIPFFFAPFLPNRLPPERFSWLLTLPWRNNPKGVVSVLKCVVTMLFYLFRVRNFEGREDEKKHQNTIERSIEMFLHFVCFWALSGSFLLPF